MGFNYAYVFDLKNKTYAYKEVKADDIHMKRRQTIREKKLEKYME